MVACGGEVVVEAACNAAAADDVAAAGDVTIVDGVVVLVAVGAVDAVDVWVQQCRMRACTNP